MIDSLLFKQSPASLSLSLSLSKYIYIYKVRDPSSCARRVIEMREFTIKKKRNPISTIDFKLPIRALLLNSAGKSDNLLFPIQNRLLLLLFTLWEFFTSANTDGLSLEFESQQVSSSLQDSFQYSGHSQ